MKTKYNVGETVMLKGIIDSIHATKDGTQYCVTIFDGNAGWNNTVNIAEKLLEKMQPERSE